MKILMTGSGGFLGGHLIRRLLSDGHEVRAADIKPLKDWWQVYPEPDNRPHIDLRFRENCMGMCCGIDQVYNLAADMGGIGHIETHKADCMLNVLINTHMLMAARFRGVSRYLFTSSACVYAADKQDRPDQPALKETDAYPAMAEDGYGWEKLFSERMCRHFMEDYGLEVRIPRLHNAYGPMGEWTGGREKAPAAICRKVAQAKMTGSDTIEIWGDGTRTRSFMYVDDCVEGLIRIMRSEWREPLNLGTSESVTVNQLVDLVEKIAGVKLKREYDLSKGQGVRGRNSDNSLIQLHFGWQPTMPLKVGLAETYRWIEEKVAKELQE